LKLLVWWYNAATVYRKSLRVASCARKDTTSGEIVNLMAVDCQRIADLMPYINMIWSSPLQIGVSIIMLYQILGPSVFAGKSSPQFFIRARIFKRAWGPGIDSKEWIPPAHVGWRAVTITLFLLGSKHL
jgi:hypothetical protein